MNLHIQFSSVSLLSPSKNDSAKIINPLLYTSYYVLLDTLLCFLVHSTLLFLLLNLLFVSIFTDSFFVFKTKCHVLIRACVMISTHEEHWLFLNSEAKKMNSILLRESVNTCHRDRNGISRLKFVTDSQYGVFQNFEHDQFQSKPVKMHTL